MRSLLRPLHRALRGIGGPVPVFVQAGAVFGGVGATVVACSVCGAVTTSREMFTDLAVAVDDTFVYDNGDGWECSIFNE